MRVVIFVIVVSLLCLICPFGFCKVLFCRGGGWLSAQINSSILEMKYVTFVERKN